MVRFLYGSSKLFSQLKRITRIREYIAQRIMAEEDLIIRLYAKLDELHDLGLYSGKIEKYDYIEKGLIDRGFKIVHLATLRLVYEKDGEEIELRVSRGEMIVDEWLNLHIVLNHIKEFNYQNLDYKWIDKITKLLEGMDYNPDRVAEWYIGRMREILETIEEVCKEADYEVNIATIKDKYEERIRKLMAKYVIPYYSYIYKLIKRIELDNNDTELKSLIWSWLTEKLQSLVGYNDGKRKVEVRDMVYSLSIEFKGNNASIHIALDPDFKKSGTHIYISNLFTGRSEIDWFINFLEERVPKFPSALKEGIRKMRRQVRLVSKIMREYPEIYL